MPLEHVVTTPNISASKPSCSDDDRAAGRAVGEPAAPAAVPEAPVRPTVLHPDNTWWNTPRSWRLELFLAFCSAWVAVQLWVWPDQFPLGHTQTALSAGMGGHERFWALVCGIAALLKVSGLACRLWTPWTTLSAGLMISGLFMSIVIWTIVGTTWAFDFPHSLAPIILIGGALGAAWQLSQWKPPPRTGT
jgi:hypothetical protein